MDVEEYKDVFNELTALASVARTLNNEEIQSYEALVNGKFSEDYKKFLTHIGSGWGMFLTPKQGIDFAPMFNIDFDSPFPFDISTTSELLERSFYEQGGFKSDLPIGGLLPISEYSLFFGERKATGTSCDCIVVRGAQLGRIWSHCHGEWFPASFVVEGKRMHTDFAGFLAAIRLITWV